METYQRAISSIKGRLDGDYQHDGVKWMLEREEDEKIKGGILADDMGLGKTMQAIATMRGNEQPTLIISIVGTVNQWRDALVEFGGYKPLIINPSFMGILPNNVTVAITTYSSFQKAKPPPCLLSYPWKRVVLDEGHVIRNPATKLFKEISKLQSEIRWILSGTPIQNSKKDLKTLAGWVGVPKSEDIEAITSKYILRRTQEGQAQSNPKLALPPLTTSVIKLKFESKNELKFYNAIEDYYASKAHTTFDAIEGLTRCRQACTNPMLYISGLSKKSGKKRRHADLVESADDHCGGSGRRKGPPDIKQFWKTKDEEISCTKVKHLVCDIVEHTKTAKCLVFCIWTNEMKLLQQELKDKGVPALIYDGQLSRDNKEAILYNFKNADIPVLIIQINCGSSGLNLQCANKVYITSPHYNPCVELQAIGRAYRKGQTEPVSCVRYVMSGTIEEKCMEIQDRKMSIIVEAMKDDSLLSRLSGSMECESDLMNLFRKEVPMIDPVEIDGLAADVSLSDLLDELLAD